MRKTTLALVFFLAGALASGSVRAQQEGQESIEIGLSTDSVSITSGFSGTNLTIFGALDNADPLVSRQGRYDVIVVLEGPARPVVVRKKTRVLGMWINTDSQEFANVPTSYAVAMTRMPQDITNTGNYSRLAVGAENLHIRPQNGESPATIEEFTKALFDEKKASGLYTERVGGVQFLSRNLFRATLMLAPNVPVGTHRARAFLFRNGTFIRETSAALTIQKAGAEQRIYEVAHDYSFAYGSAAVFLAIITGWIGRLVFRRD
ncbi:uncharacterized protein (TIGR02186 family) [Mesorhizobium sp. J18]|uniref:TIGR02186 family protein n=1 Tax=Mesorhizobium sp. J18 TaxID=935263 RepID=UPI00119B1BB4|nr:TIGR02186 family protein [Mesorhizobium sp. J18]TWG99947.1 uncharacterized protein (TIGR02186 family) [Mesorhizobium sp. J18]